MLLLLKRNPLQRILLHQITQTQLPFLHPNLISNGNLINPQTGSFPFTGFFFFSSAASNPRQEFPKIKEPALDFFHCYGFTDTQIRKFIHKCPSVRSIETIKPKLKHLLAFGFSPSELIRVICFFPTILGSSLKERIEPNLSLLEATFGSKKHIIKAVIRGPWLITSNLEKHVIPNLKILRENSIPMSNITHLFMKYPHVLSKDSNLLEIINKLKGLGMNPSSTTFNYGMNVIATSKKETWERKMELYRSFGWSEKDTLSAFSRLPACMGFLDNKITKAFKFFKEMLHWDSTLILRRPVVLGYSLNGRIVPRCAVLSVLAKNELWNGEPKLYTVLNMAEKNFEEKFVDKYEKEVPEVIDAYKGKIDFVGFESVDAESLKS